MDKMNSTKFTLYIHVGILLLFSALLIINLCELIPAKFQGLDTAGWIALACYATMVVIELIQVIIHIRAQHRNSRS